MIRLATAEDIPAVTEIYRKLTDLEAAGKGVTGWIGGIYPVQQTAEDSLLKGHLFVLEDNGKICASARINSEQGSEYELCPWTIEAPREKVLVIHTLTVDPDEKGHGYGSRFIRFYEELALSGGYTVLRLDTNQKNLPARKLYAKLGYSEAGIVPCNFNGIPNVQLVCMEKRVQKE